MSRGYINKSSKGDSYKLTPNVGKILNKKLLDEQDVPKPHG
jgi:hypothetical protein